MKRFRITWSYRSEHVFTIRDIFRIIWAYRNEYDFTTQDILCFNESEALHLNISPSQYAIDKAIEEKNFRQLRAGKWTIEHIEELI